MVSCAVSDCYVTHRNNSEKYTFHRLPTDAVIQKTWLKIINRVAYKKNITVCSKHFEAKCFIQRKHRRVLLKDSMPTLFVPVQLKHRIPCSYVNRNVSPPSVEHLPGPSREVRSPSRQKLIKKCFKLQKKIVEKNKLLKNAKAKIKRISKHLLYLQTVVKELCERPVLKDHQSDVKIECENKDVEIIYCKNELLE